MHELSIAIQITEIIEEEAKNAGADAVLQVQLEIGELSGVEMDALEMAMQEAVRGTIASEAELIYHRIAAKAVCESCCNEFDPIDVFKICPYCNSLHTNLLKGKELKIRSIEVVTK